MGDLQVVSTTFMGCRAEIKKEDQCKINICVRAQDDTVVDCFAYLERNGDFILKPSHEARFNDLLKKHPKFKISNKQIKEYLAVHQILEEHLLDKKKLQEAGVNNFDDVQHPDNPYRRLLELKNFLLFGDVNPNNQSSIDERRSIVETIFYLEKNYPQIAKIVDDTYKQVSAKRYAIPDATSRFDWLSAALNTRTAIAISFEDYLVREPKLKPLVENMAQEIVAVIFSGAPLSNLANQSFFKTIQLFHDTFGFGEHEGELFIQKITDATGFKVPVLFDDEDPKMSDMVTRCLSASAYFQKMIDEKLPALLIKGQKDPEGAFKESLMIQYANSIEKKQILGIITQHLELDTQSANGPTYLLDMESIHDAIKMGAEKAENRSQYLAAVNEFLVLLFAKDTEFRAFWKGRYRPVESFHNVLGFGTNRYWWGELIHWVRDEVDSQQTIGYPLRLLGLAGDGLLGLGGSALLIGGAALEDPMLLNTSWFLLGAGLGGATGNLACWGMDLSNEYFLCDLIGGIIVGSLAVYLGNEFLNPLFLTEDSTNGMPNMTNNPMPNNSVNNTPNNNPGNNEMMPGMRWPVDIFGP